MNCRDHDGNQPYPRVSLVAPDPWLTAHAGLLSVASSPALDVACGRGHNALWIASSGLRVTGVDRSTEAVECARECAARRRLPAVFQALDLESGEPFPGGPRHWGVIAVFHYLHREIFPVIEESLAPGGLLLYKTHLEHRLRAPGSRPRRPQFLLRPGELLASFPALVSLDYREWTADGGAFAALLARRALYSS